MSPGRNYCNRAFLELRPGLHRLLIAALIVILLAACNGSTPPSNPTQAAPAKEIIFYDWEEDMPQSVLDAFTAEYGVSVIYQTFDSFEEAINNIRAGEVYDVINLETPYIPTLIAEGRLAEIDYANVPNFKNISPNFRELVYDPENKYTIPYNWGTTGLIVRNDLIGSPLTRWENLWDAQYAGKVTILSGEPREVLGATLKSLGYSANSEVPAELEAALTRLLELKPNLPFTEYSHDSLSAMLGGGKIIVGMGLAEDVLETRQLAPHITYILPEEGALMWVSHLAIPTSSPHKATAELFLNFILRPEIAAQIVNENYQATANEAAQPFINSEILNDPVIFPPNEHLVNAEMIMPLSAAGQQLYEEMWERFTTAP